MKFSETAIAGVFVIDLERHEDDRGFFARSWSRDELARVGLRSELAQCSFSYNARVGTLRGMHYQAVPHAETKIVSCVRGAIYDVALDLRPQSPTFRRWTAVTLSGETLRMLYVPEGCAHGFQTLATPGVGALVHYQISPTRTLRSIPGASGGTIRPSASSGHPRGIDARVPVRNVDAHYPDFEP